MGVHEASCGASCSCEHNHSVRLLEAPPCNCECRHLRRFFARAEDAGVLRNEIKEFDFDVYNDDIVEFEVPTTWGETRVMYVPEEMSFTSALPYYFTRNEVAEMFHAYAQCDCCPRHQTNVPVSPFLN
tara:strand:- start:147 stop:530 length:384 start_codon:yes stop_codon:yes gene_type:complete